jgi:glycerate kinase
MAQALGISFTDDTGWEIRPGGGNLGAINKIDRTNLDPRLAHCRIFAACDVTNPLTGALGAAHIFGPQKGATPEMVRLLEDNMKHYARVLRETTHVDVESIPGSGAAGGMGAGILALLGGTLKPGFELISQAVRLEEWIGWADLVVTGEGRMDYQTAYGKTPAGVSGVANRLHKPVIAFTGSLGEEFNTLRALNFTAVIPIADKPMTLEHSLSEAGKLLENSAERVMRLIQMGKIL